MFLQRIALLLCVSLCVTLAKNNVKDAIGFPEQEEDINSLNKDNRQPVFVPSMCPVNELLYPGDQKDDWICDCRPAHLYHPASGACWPAYQRGPCPDGQYLIMPANSVLPVCQKNPCTVDTFVQWNRTCQKLGSPKPCSHLYPAAASLGVNATTLSVGCLKLSVQQRFGETSSVCPIGCKRSINGQCKAI